MEKTANCIFISGYHNYDNLTNQVTTNKTIVFFLLGLSRYIYFQNETCWVLVGRVFICWCINIDKQYIQNIYKWLFLSISHIVNVLWNVITVQINILQIFNFTDINKTKAKKSVMCSNIVILCFFLIFLITFLCCYLVFFVNEDKELRSYIFNLIEHFF